MRIKTTTAFRANMKRDLGRKIDAAKYLVHPLNKNGELSKAREDWNKVRKTFKEAEELRDKLESMNPGYKYAIIDMDTAALVR